MYGRTRHRSIARPGYHREDDVAPGSGFLRDQLRVGDLVVNTLSKQVTVGGVVVPLSVKEFQLLATLASEPERGFSKQELLELVWGFKSPARTPEQPSTAAALVLRFGVSVATAGRRACPTGGGVGSCRRVGRGSRCGDR